MSSIAPFPNVAVRSLYTRNACFYRIISDSGRSATEDDPDRDLPGRLVVAEGIVREDPFCRVSADRIIPPVPFDVRPFTQRPLRSRGSGVPTMVPADLNGRETRNPLRSV